MPAQEEAEPRKPRLRVPADLAKALAGSIHARAAFKNMSVSHRKEYLDWIQSAKRPETRARRIAKAVDMIGAGERLK